MFLSIDSFIPIVCYCCYRSRVTWILVFFMKASRFSILFFVCASGIVFVPISFLLCLDLVDSGCRGRKYVVYLSDLANLLPLPVLCGRERCRLQLTGGVGTWVSDGKLCVSGVASSSGERSSDFLARDQQGFFWGQHLLWPITIFGRSLEDHSHFALVHAKVM